MNNYHQTLFVTLLLVTAQFIFATHADDSDVVDAPQNNEPVQNDQDEEKSEDEIIIAPNLDLKEVAPAPEPVVTKPESEEESTLREEPNTGEKSEDHSNQKTTPDAEEKETSKITSENETLEREKLVLLGAEVPVGTATRLSWSPQVSISGLALPTPVLVINGSKPGPTLCLTGAIHGDELNGIEVVRRVMYDIKPENLSGTVIGVPIVNLPGFQRGSRYLSDRRDLNRYFPGESNGSLASRIANSLFSEVIKHCTYLIDLHTGSLRRTNLPQIRANMNNPEVAEFVGGFDKIAVVHHSGNPGMLRTAANEAGIIALTMELGESLRVQENQIAAGTHSVNSFLDKIEMYPRVFIWGEPRPAYYQSTWIRAESGGILFSKKGLGDNVSVGDVLGIVTDPITNQSADLISPINGQIIGMAVNQVVMPGFAAYHIGIESNEEEMANSEVEEKLEANPNGELGPEE